MQNELSTPKQYTVSGSGYQLLLPFNIEARIPGNDSVRLVRNFIGNLNLSPLYQTYSHHEKEKLSARQMLEILVYANMNGMYSSRKIESACRRDINFMYLLNGKSAPDHATIARFRSGHLAPCMKQLFAGMEEELSRLGEISGKNLFIDGTKIESCANKYTFVWKKSVTKNQQKVLDKLPGFLSRIDEAYGIRVRTGKELKISHLKRIRRQLKRLQQENEVIFVHGKGKHKTELQKALEELDSYILRLKDYTEKRHIAGERNSYAKTDPDATFMRLKEDSMKNGQLKPAYNVQFGVDAEYIVWVTESPHPTDVRTLIPFLQDFEKYSQKRYAHIIADAGYESEENYRYLEDHKQAAYIKPANYETRKSLRSRKDIGLRENMQYDAAADTYTCANGKKLAVSGIKTERLRSGYQVEKTQYSCEDCSGCPLKSRCIHGNNSKLPLEQRTKHFEVSKYFQTKRTEAQQLITSKEGIQLRMNRSIQSEGAFGVVKGNMLLAMGYNIK